jgi:hypothetical protein
MREVNMKNSQPPTFSSPELQQVVDAARPVLEGVEEARNRVSNDIKALEAYLQNLNLSRPFRHSLGKHIVPKGTDQEFATSLEYGGSASGWIEEEALTWGEDKGGRFRLLYELNRWQGYVEVDAPGGPFFWDDATLQRETKPLIETKFEVRKRMNQHLPDFVGCLAAHLDIDAKFQYIPF